MGSGSVERCLRGEEGGCEAAALARGPSWPGGGGRSHPYPRPVPARNPTTFAFGTKQASGTHVSITPGGARRRGVSRTMSGGHSEPPPSLGAFQDPWDLGGYRGHVPARVTGRVPPGTGGSAGGAKLAARGLGSSAARGWFPRPQRAPRSVTCLQVSTRFCQRGAAAPPPARPRCWRLGSGRAGGLEDCPAPELPARRVRRGLCAPGGLRAFSLASSTGVPWTAPRTARLSLRHTRTPSKAPSRVDAPGALSPDAADQREGGSA